MYSILPRSFKVNYVMSFDVKRNMISLLHLIIQNTFFILYEKSIGGTMKVQSLMMKMS